MDTPISFFLQMENIFGTIVLYNTFEEMEMKKLSVTILFVLVLMILPAVGLFAQENTRSLIAGVNDLATNPIESWEILDPVFIKVDPISESYSFSGGFVVKNFIGNTRYDFVCHINKNGEDFDVSLENMESYACDKTGQKTKSAKVYQTSEKVAKAYSDQIKDEIKARLSRWTDEEYESALNEAVTSPAILECVAKNSSLVFKKFLKDNTVVGRNFSEEIIVTLVDEAPVSVKDYAYTVGGRVFIGYNTDKLGIKTPKYVSVYIYTNNDSVITLIPIESQELYTKNIETLESNSIYKVNGTIQDITQEDLTGDLKLIKINE